MSHQNVKNEQHEDKAFRFYQIMGYPIPKNGNAFAYCSKLSVDKEGDDEFSRNEKSEYLDEYISYINKWGWIFSYLPFVKEIYLANSITFNSLSSESDIDLFVVCKRGRVWTSRLLVSFFMMFFGIKRSKKDYIKKFCLSFFVDEDNENLKSIMLGSKDVYLVYWVAHLVPLYVEIGEPTIYNKNPWVKTYLLNIDLKQNIFLGNKLFSGKRLFKKSVESIFSEKFGDRFENFVQEKWGSRMKKIIAKNPDAHKGTVYEKGMLKFYKDMRKYYSDLFFGRDN